jgi:hypothetical protein
MGDRRPIFRTDKSRRFRKLEERMQIRMSRMQRVMRWIQIIIAKYRGLLWSVPMPMPMPKEPQKTPSLKNQKPKPQSRSAFAFDPRRPK